MSNIDDNVTTGEKVGIIIILACFYFGIGVIVISFLGGMLGVMPAPNTFTNAEFFGVVLLWPLFLIKYVAIGLWAAFSSGFSLLF